MIFIEIHRSSNRLIYSLLEGGVTGRENHTHHGLAPPGNPAAYSSSKGGLIQLSRWLAVTLAPNIRVNSICLGGVHNKQNKLFKARYEKEVPLNRMATPKDLLGAIILLSSDMSKYITGQSVKVDGGWSAW